MFLFQPKLLETLMTAEKHSHYQNSVNCYRKLLGFGKVEFRGSEPIFVWRESGEPFRENHPISPDRDSNLDLPILDSPAKHETSTLANYATEAVCDLLPLLVSSSVSLPPKQLFRLLNKAIEFSLNYLLSPTKLIQDLPELESKIEDPWVHLFLVVQGSGKKLGWDLSTMFGVPW
ncbi:unnamed protein product [Timema podura]|uniref:Integrator complex subunit 10 n=1 Tax=Timema podura TaxID=61482 RepID=A0ABN7P729_TIMPD|nr:unnamed protein product [Timema podura]